MLTSYDDVNFLREAYQVPKKYHSDAIAYIVRTKSPLSFENYLVQVQQGTLSRIDAYNGLGMIIPPAISEADYVQYIQDNVASYLPMLKRQKVHLLPLFDWERMSDEDITTMLGTSSDMELFNATQAYVPYSSRAQLLVRLRTLRNSDNFFLPLSVKYATNSETLMATDVNELPLDHSVAISFGKLTRYRVYEVDDLIHSFSVEIDGAAGPRRPENAGNRAMNPSEEQFFTLEHIQQLNDILAVMVVNENTTTLKKLVAKHYQILLSMSCPDDQFLSVIASKSATLVDKMVQIFHNLIITAMYMRRWQGPGHSYPLEDLPVGVPEPTVQISDGILRLKVLIDAPDVLEVFNIVPLVNRSTTRLEVVPHSRLMSRFEDVADGGYCIKMGSSDFIYTAAYYLCLLGRSDLVNFDPLKVAVRG